MTQAEKGKVYLVGAGPGDPELLTLRAAKLLATADVIYHDDLVSGAVLDTARPGATVVSVGKRFGTKKTTQNEINGKLIASARQGLGVLRLKSGDPLIFGRAGEEIQALAAAGIPYEVVPGVTVALAAAAALSCSLTDRRAASSVLFLTGHHAEDLNPGLSPTRVVYMPGLDLGIYASAWLADGESPDMPCVVMSRVSHPDQTIVRLRLDDLSRITDTASPSILLAGWALAGMGTNPALQLEHLLQDVDLRRLG